MISNININTEFRVPKVSVTRDGKYEDLQLPEPLIQKINELVITLEGIRSPEDMAKWRAVESMAKNLQDEQLIGLVDMFQEFTPREFVLRTALRKYNRRLYRAKTDHICEQADELKDEEKWEKVGANLPVREYIKPQDINQAYQIDDKIKFEGKVYKCVIEPTFHSPKEFPAAWEEV